MYSKEEAEFVQSFHEGCNYMDNMGDWGSSGCQDYGPVFRDGKNDVECEKCQECVYDGSRADAYFAGTLTLLIVTCCIVGCIVTFVGMFVDSGSDYGNDEIFPLGTIIWLKSMNLASDWGFTEFTLSKCDPNDHTGLYATAFGFCIFGSLLLLFDWAGVGTRYLVGTEKHEGMRPMAIAVSHTRLHKSRRDSCETLQLPVRLCGLVTVCGTRMPLPGRQTCR